jgi:hypothetical protein
MILHERGDLPDGLICRTRLTASSLGLNGSGERPPDGRLRDSSAEAQRVKAVAAGIEGEVARIVARPS